MSASLALWYLARIQAGAPGLESAGGAPPPVGVPHGFA